MRKHILAASLALLLCTAAHAGFTPNPAAKALMDEGWAAKAAQHYQEAADKFSAAAKADPQASAPLSALAALVFNLTPGDGPKAESGRKQVRFLVQRALALAPFDPVAQEILRLLDDVTPAPLHLATPAAAPLFAEAEALFEKRDYDAAVAKYEAAAAADPLLSRAWVYAGDCFFMREQYVEAERRYRKGAEIEPLNSQAWRFLSDALLKQGKGQAAIDALIQGIAAQPSQLPNWDKLAIAGARNGMPLKRLGLVRKASATVDPASGKPTINLDPSAVKNKQDGALWLMIGMSDMLRLTDAATAAKGQPDASPFQRELASWRDAFKTSAELEAKSGELLVDPALATMQMLYRENQLEAGLLLLAYKESWRPDLEAWKKANPDGVQRFIKSYGLRP